MGHSQADKLLTHERILNVASKGFRDLGIDGMSIADIMGEAGATVGAFYKHFDTRDSLVTEAIDLAFSDREQWEAKTRKNLRGGIRDYLSYEHRDNVASSCIFSSLSSDIRRSQDETRTIYTEQMKKILGLLDESLPLQIDVNRHQKAAMLFAALVGAMTLARSTNDEKLSGKILKGVADELIQFLTPSNA